MVIVYLKQVISDWWLEQNGQKLLVIWNNADGWLAIWNNSDGLFETIVVSDCLLKENSNEW